MFVKLLLTIGEAVFARLDVNFVNQHLARGNICVCLRVSEMVLVSEMVSE